MDDKQELRLRRRAIRLRLQGTPHQGILEKVQRSRAWLSKWQERFGDGGPGGRGACRERRGRPLWRQSRHE